MVHIYGSRPSNDTTLCSARISGTHSEEHSYATDAESFEQPDKPHGCFGIFSRDGSRHHDCQERFSLTINILVARYTMKSRVFFILKHILLPDFTCS